MQNISLLIITSVILFCWLQELAQRFSTKEQHEAELTNQLAAAEEREQETEMKMQELLDRSDTQNTTIQEMRRQIEKLKQDKYILRALITELDVSIAAVPDFISNKKLNKEKSVVIRRHIF